MDYVVREWLNLALRWTHVFAAIMWVGQTYFFTWLDHAFSKESQVWMVHSGGFYIVDKQKRPELRAQTLHWFKWEAAFTFIVGWFVYDLLWISPLAKNEIAATVVSYLLIVATIVASVHIFAARAAYMQVGAMLGAYMALNVWIRIIPAQRQLIDAVTN